jgi:uncharacterized iron-regulated membrane protein
VSSVIDKPSRPLLWQQWFDHPELVPLRQFVFQLHLWLGICLAAWVCGMSITGSVLVFSDELAPVLPVGWLVQLHSSLLAGSRGKLVNAMGAVVLMALCGSGAVIWWPGRAHWRRSYLRIEWRAHLPRIIWDAHNALGFWCFGFVAIWGVSGLYLSRSQAFNFLYRLDPQDRLTDPVLFALAMLHFGRFNLATQIVWSIVGLVPATLALTGVFICCRRVLLHKPSNPKHAAAP